jgi:HD-like signal output (HDOD) protein
MRTAHGPGAALALRVSDQSFLLGRSLEHVVGREIGMLCGAFHGLGTLAFLSRFGEDYAAMLCYAEAGDCARRDEMELERFGMTHDAMAAGLAGLWGIAPKIVDAIAWHCHPTQSDKGGQLGLALRAACSRSESIAALDDRRFAGLDESTRSNMLSRV